jgi:hypothetical protein
MRQRIHSKAEMFTSWQPGNEEKEGEEETKDKKHPSKASPSDLLPPIQSHLLEFPLPPNGLLSLESIHGLIH